MQSKKQRKAKGKPVMDIKPIETPEESKLLILYLFDKIDFELSDLQVLRVFVDLDLMNYFDLMNYLGVLTTGEMLLEKELPTGKCLSITQKGRDILAEFKEEIRNSYRVRISEYCAQHKQEMQAESQFVGGLLPAGPKRVPRYIENLGPACDRL